MKGVGIKHQVAIHLSKNTINTHSFKTLVNQKTNRIKDVISLN